MVDRNRSDYRNQDYGESRQAEQFQDNSTRQQGGYEDQSRWQDDNQMGEPARGGADYYYEEVILVPRRSRSEGRSRGYGTEPDQRDRSDSREYRDRGDFGGYGRPRDYGAQPGRRYSSFTSEDQGGRDFSSPTGRWSSRYGAAPAGRYSDGYRGEGGYSRPRYSDSPRERDWWDRTTDEIASWFGDDDAQRRREMDHRGRGPSDYTRSDERIREDVNDNLTEDWAVDARKVRVKVEKGEVTLDGTVSTRLQKRRAEDCAEDVSGVTHVQNNLRVDANTGPTESGTTVPTETGKTS